MGTNTHKNLPVGVQDFESLIHDGYLYVDKTEQIWRLTQWEKQCGADDTSKVKSVSECAFYIMETAAQGWSRDIMLANIAAGHMANKGKVIANLPDEEQ